MRRKAPGFSLDMEAAANEEQLALREDEAEVWRQSVKATRRGVSKLTIDEAGVKPGEKGAKGYGRADQEENNKRSDSEAMV